MHHITLRVILKRIGALVHLLRDKTVPLRKKALVIFGIVYLLTPVDIIPPVLFPFAVVDDMIVWAYILGHLAKELDTYWLGEKKENFSKKFRDKTFVEGVKFNVEDNAETETDDDKE